MPDESKRRYGGSLDATGLGITGHHPQDLPSAVLDVHLTGPQYREPHRKHLSTLFDLKNWNLIQQTLFNEN